MQVRDAFYIGGAWVPPGGTGSIEVLNATTEEVMGTVPEGTPGDADRAVAAARSAFASWAGTTVDERARYLRRTTEALQARMDEIASIVTAEVGMPRALSGLIQAGLPVLSFMNTAQVLVGHPFEERIGSSVVVHEPVGVVGCITPWNYPLHQVAAKVAPALAAGCTVVLKPSEVAPLTAFLLADVLDEIGLPAGVFNLVTGPGPVVGEAIVTHADVDMVSFTGSTVAGRRVGELAAATVKRVALELGGKSANVILDDADLDRAVSDGVSRALLNSGQTCVALSRMLVPRHRLAEAEDIALRAAATYTPGDPFAEGTRLGPLASAAQRDRVRSFIDQGIAEGARLLTGGPEVPGGLDRGFFVAPTVFSDVTNDMTIAREEIFGPVLAIIPYDDDDEAVRIANDSIYGLAGAVWSGDVERATAVARRIRTGQVDINGAGFNPMAPFGGYKQSGHGRELGRFGLEEFLETKSLQL